MHLRWSVAILLLNGAIHHLRQQLVSFGRTRGNVSVQYLLFGVGAYTQRFTVEDRYDPYPNAAKRRAVSPSYNPHRRDSQSRPTIGNTRFPIPIAIPTSSASSTTSSPTVSSSQASVSLPRQMSISSSHVSSPIMRPTIGMPSPVLRPILRASWQMEGEEREVEGAGEGVNGLTIAGT